MLLFLVACQKDTPTESGPGIPGADAGPDLTTAIGNFAIIDISNSTGGPETVSLYRWEESDQNPDNVSLHSNNDEVFYNIGFETPGEYEFYLTVETESMVSEPDTIHVSVSSERGETPIQDIRLELSIRYKDANGANGAYTGIIDEQYLAAIDSVKRYGKSVQSLEGLQYCTNLIYLRMTLQDITDLTPLQDLHNLEYLGLSQNFRLRNISPLNDLVNLRYLNLDSAEYLSDISPLENMVNLEYLNIFFTDIESYDAISKMISLKQLYMNHINTNDISFVSGLVNLEQIWFTYSNISDIAPLKELVNLEIIYGYGNEITDLSPLGDLVNLKYLSLEDNAISDIQPLAGLVNLETVKLYDNNIIDIKPLVDNDGIGNNDGVLLMDNPLNEKSRNEYIPMLQERGVEVYF